MRHGRVQRVASVATLAQAVAVYNLEVERLHSYAVGQSGALVHNANYTSGEITAAKELAEVTKKPAVTLEKTAKAEVTTPGGAKASAPEAPARKSSKPSSDGAERAHARKPTTAQMTHRTQITRQHGESFTVADDVKLKPLFDNYDEARKAGTLTNELGKEIGEAGAKQWMKTRKPKAELVHTGAVHGKDDLDFVYQEGKTFFVVEAKGMKSSRDSRNIGTKLDPKHAQQGSAEYLDGTFKVMRNSGDPVKEGIAKKLQDARDGIDGFKVVYLEVATKKKAAGPGFTITHFIE